MGQFAPTGAALTARDRSFWQPASLATARPPKLEFPPMLIARANEVSALDLAKALRERDIPVAIGGFHVSGTLSMLDGHLVQGQHRFREDAPAPKRLTRKLE
jgi:hypothetical protein